LAQHQLELSDGTGLRVLELNPSISHDRENSLQIYVDPRDIVILSD